MVTASCGELPNQTTAETAAADGVRPGSVVYLDTAGVDRSAGALGHREPVRVDTRFDLAFCADECGGRSALGRCHRDAPSDRVRVKTAWSAL